MTSEQNATPRKYADVNAVVDGLLRDLALRPDIATAPFGYKRAASRDARARSSR